MFTLRKHTHGLGASGKTTFRIAQMNVNGAPHSDANVDLTPLEYQGAIPLDLIKLNAVILKKVLSGIDESEFKEIAPEISGTKWGATNTAKGNNWSDIKKVPQILQELVQNTEALLREIFPEEVLDGAIHFNDFSLRKYPGSTENGYAISPHRDQEKYINLIVVWVLTGESAFCVCKDKEGTGSKLVDVVAGQPIIMRGAGYAGISDRPYHYVTQTKPERITFTLRQIKERS